MINSRQQLEKIKKQYSEDCNYVEADKINDKIKQIKSKIVNNIEKLLISLLCNEEIMKLTSAVIK